MRETLENEAVDITALSLDDAARVSGGRIKLIGPVTVRPPDTGVSWATSITDAPASDGVGIVIHF